MKPKLRKMLLRERAITLVFGFPKIWISKKAKLLISGKLDNKSLADFFRQ